MAANFQPVAIFAHMVGVMHHPAREPQHLVLELPENLELIDARELVSGTIHMTLTRRAALSHMGKDIPL